MQQRNWSTRMWLRLLLRLKEQPLSLLETIADTRWHFWMWLHSVPTTANSWFRKTSRCQFSSRFRVTNWLRNSVRRQPTEPSVWTSSAVLFQPSRTAWEDPPGSTFSASAPCHHLRRPPAALQPLPARETLMNALTGKKSPMDSSKASSPKAQTSKPRRSLTEKSSRTQSSRTELCRASNWRKATTSSRSAHRRTEPRRRSSRRWT